MKKILILILMGLFSLSAFADNYSDEYYKGYKFPSNKKKYTNRSVTKQRKPIKKKKKKVQKVKPFKLIYFKTGVSLLDQGNNHEKWSNSTIGYRNFSNNTYFGFEYIRLKDNKTKVRNYIFDYGYSFNRTKMKPYLGLKLGYSSGEFQSLNFEKASGISLGYEVGLNLYKFLGFQIGLGYSFLSNKNEENLDTKNNNLFISVGCKF